MDFIHHIDLGGSEMKYFISIFVLLSYGWAGSVENSGTPTYRSGLESLVETQERPIPIPFDAQRPFPWSFVEGGWFAKWGEFESYYTFKIVRRRGSVRQLRVKQIDVSTCEVVAVGQGADVPNQKRVVAQMTYPATGQVYLMSIRSYDHDRMPGDLGIKPIQGQMVIMSITPLQTNVTYNVPLEKQAGLNNFKCLPIINE